MLCCGLLDAERVLLHPRDANKAHPRNENGGHPQNASGGNLRVANGVDPRQVNVGHPRRVHCGSNKFLEQESRPSEHEMGDILITEERQHLVNNSGGGDGNKSTCWLG